MYEERDMRYERHINRKDLSQDLKAKA